MKTLHLLLSRELVRILNIYMNARVERQSVPTFKEFRQQFVGASGLSLPSYVAHYIIASSDSEEEFSSNTVAALITLIEIAVLLEGKYYLCQF